MSNLALRLKKTFKDKEYRHGYVDEFLNASIATQIKVLREQRGWNQEELANRSGMLQPRISVLENVNYSSWSIASLRKLAEAFDVTLSVTFETFGKRLTDIVDFSRESLECVPFTQDSCFQQDRQGEICTYTSVAFREAVKGNTQGNVVTIAAYKAAQETTKPKTGESPILAEKEKSGFKKELTAAGAAA